mmetsp:Transcript_121463/g.220911  ORF Transcript_121463/g.220911 Transcript_121463/m.220911 type:complete len:102 (+) Transcript_121463:189-494(+)
MRARNAQRAPLQLPLEKVQAKEPVDIQKEMLLPNQKVDIQRSFVPKAVDVLPLALSRHAALSARVETAPMRKTALQRPAWPPPQMPVADRRQAGQKAENLP